MVIKTITILKTRRWHWQVPSLLMFSPLNLMKYTLWCGMDDILNCIWKFIKNILFRHVLLKITIITTSYWLWWLHSYNHILLFYSCTVKNNFNFVYCPQYYVIVKTKMLFISAKYNYNLGVLLTFPDPLQWNEFYLLKKVIKTF